VLDATFGESWPAEKRHQVAAAQNLFWDHMGPLVEAYQRGLITEEDYHARADRVVAEDDAEMRRVLSEEEYERLFSVD
jgi:hypothetical protein